MKMDGHSRLSAFVMMTAAEPTPRLRAGEPVTMAQVQFPVAPHANGTK
jgi:hypothetical protein